jgi:hypothetical protein
MSRHAHALLLLVAVLSACADGRVYSGAPSSPQAAVGEGEGEGEPGEGEGEGEGDTDVEPPPITDYTGNGDAPPLPPALTPEEALPMVWQAMASMARTDQRAAVRVVDALLADWTPADTCPQVTDISGGASGGVWPYPSYYVVGYCTDKHGNAWFGGTQMYGSEAIYDGNPRTYRSRTMSNGGGYMTIDYPDGSHLELAGAMSVTEARDETDAEDFWLGSSSFGGKFVFTGPSAMNNQMFGRTISAYYIYADQPSTFLFQQGSASVDVPGATALQMIGRRMPTQAVTPCQDDAGCAGEPGGNRTCTMATDASGWGVCTDAGVIPVRAFIIEPCGDVPFVGAMGVIELRDDNGVWHHFDFNGQEDTYSIDPTGAYHLVAPRSCGRCAMHSIADGPKTEVCVEQATIDALMTWGETPWY